VVHVLAPVNLITPNLTQDGRTKRDSPPPPATTTGPGQARFRHLGDLAVLLRRTIDKAASFVPRATYAAQIYF